MKLSIVTINYNNIDGLKKTVESVVSQTNHEFEYIIVDGASTDGGAEYIKEIGDKSYPFALKWISEKDTGIYNAMNKGVRMAKGEYVLMLNSGDYFVDEHVVESILPELDGTDVVQGNNIEERNGHTYRNRGYGKTEIDMFDIVKGYFLHQASFSKRDLFERCGYFDESYKMCADTKFFMNCLGLHDATFRYVDVDITNYDVMGISAEYKGPWAQRHKEELQRLRQEVFSSRMYEFMTENDKKIRLYDYLHKHAWVWNLIMAITHIANVFYKLPADRIIERVD